MATRAKRTEPRESDQDEEDVYEVERIIDTRAGEGEVLYRVRWKNYSSDDDTWEPESHLEDCREVLLAYKKNLAEIKPKKDTSMKLPMKSDLFDADSESDKDKAKESSVKRKKKKKMEESDDEMLAKEKKKKEKKCKDDKALPAPESDEEEESRDPSSTPSKKESKKRLIESDEDDIPVPGKKPKKDGKPKDGGKPKKDTIEEGKKKVKSKKKIESSDDEGDRNDESHTDNTTNTEAIKPNEEPTEEGSEFPLNCEAKDRSHKRAKQKAFREDVEELLIVSDQEDTDFSSAADSVSSGDEADFLEGIDPFQDIAKDVREPLEPSEPSVPNCKESGSSGDKANIIKEIDPSQETAKDVIERLEPPEPISLTAPNHFDGWKTEKDPDHLPESPQPFLPKRKPGVQPPLSTSLENPTPIELFNMYFESSIKTLCANTNKKAARNIAEGKKCKWTEVTKKEMCKYIGLTIYMGILRLPNLRDYWCAKSICHAPYSQKVMSRDRFFNIRWNIHLSDPAKDAANKRIKGTDKYDCLHRIRPLYDTLRVACKALYHPDKNLFVDERMVGTNARVSLKPFIKNEPTRCEIKLFVLCDSSGYTVDFNIYTGRYNVGGGKGLSFDAVMSLVSKEFLGSGYHIYCDHFYTSPVLFKHLHSLGFGACGTIKETRIGFPKTKVNALTKTSPRGSIRWIREGTLLFTKWMDTREVNVCTTLHTAYSGETLTRLRKYNRGYKILEVPVPTAVKDYNHFMRGVDLSDQSIGSCCSWKKSRKWYLTVLHHFIDIAVTNSYSLYKQLCNSKNEQPMSHRAFQEQLAAELCGVSLAPTWNSYHHIPVAISCAVSSKNTQGYRKCKVCGKRTPFVCEACQVALCVILDRNCHKSYHS